MATPYVTPAMITNAPTGIAWSIIPFPKATTEQQFAEQTNICHRATSMVDGWVNQTFRCTIDNEVQQGPNYYITIDNNTGQIRWILQRWPVTEILAVQTAPNVLPPTWTQVTSGQWRIDMPVLGVYGSYTAGGSGGSGGQTIYIGAGWGGWWLGRNGFLVAASYLNGWPHAGLIESCEVGATSLYVDDVTGMTGATVTIYDGASTETVSVTSVSAVTSTVLPNSGGTAAAGPGTLTLAAGTLFAHTGSTPASVVVTSIPGDVLWATILAATVQALESGIQATTIQNLPGSTTVGGHGTDALTLEYQRILQPFKRVI
jgi:hypothetical protein